MVKKKQQRKLLHTYRSKLKKNELKKISGGVSIWAIIGALAGLIFGIGVFEGYTRPIKCR